MVALFFISMTLTPNSHPFRPVSIPSLVEMKRPPAKTRSWMKALALSARVRRDWSSTARTATSPLAIMHWSCWKPSRLLLVPDSASSRMTRIPSVGTPNRARSRRTLRS